MFKLTLIETGGKPIIVGSYFECTFLITTTWHRIYWLLLVIALSLELPLLSKFLTNFLFFVNGYWHEMVHQTHVCWYVFIKQNSTIKAMAQYSACNFKFYLKHWTYNFHYAYLFSRSSRTRKMSLWEMQNILQMFVFKYIDCNRMQWFFFNNIEGHLNVFHFNAFTREKYDLW